MSPKRTTTPVVRNIALAYVRKSWAKSEKDYISPERQRAHIQAFCDAHGWIPEWYEDVDGHKSGMHEKNRPGWLALKRRMGDPDVIAIVANDLARLHRKGWRIGDLLDFVDQHGISLALADPNRQMDFSTLAGRTMAQVIAILDEYYAADVSLRWKSDIAHRKSQGKTVGLPPFGTKRNKEGYLAPSDEGAWFLPDGTWIAGKVGEESPHPEALWRGYFDCAERILNLYAYQDTKGRSRILATLHSEGWAFRDRDGQPAPLENDDIRRVVANWAEYGGYVSANRARQRHPADYPPEEIIEKLIPSRAVFPVDLLADVARARQKRALRQHPSDSVNRKASFYPLSGITYCAHCEALAKKHDNPKYRSLLSGRLQTSYRHKQGAACGCKNKSVQRSIIEDNFLQIINGLQVKPESLDLMMHLAIEAKSIAHEADFEQKKAEAIAICQRRIDAAVHLYGDGRISREEYLRRTEQNEREIAHWEARTTETEKVAAEIALCVAAVDKLHRLWASSDDEDKQGMARYLFEYIVFDLDKQQIVDFRLKAWADQFLVLRTGVIADEYNNEDDDDNRIVPTGIQHSRFSLNQLSSWLLRRCGILQDYRGKSRNQIICERYVAGESLSDLAREYSISPQRVFQIVNE